MLDMSHRTIHTFLLYSCNEMITSTVNGHRCYSRDMELGSLETPCEYTFTCKEKDREYMDKMKR